MNPMECLKDSTTIAIIGVVIGAIGVLVSAIGVFVAIIIHRRQKRDTEKLTEIQNIIGLTKELSGIKKDFIAILEKIRTQLSDKNLMTGVGGVFAKNREDVINAQKIFVMELKRIKGEEAVISFEKIWKKHYPKAQNNKSKTEAKRLLQETIDYLKKL